MTIDKRIEIVYTASAGKHFPALARVTGQDFLVRYCVACQQACTSVQAFFYVFFSPYVHRTASSLARFASSKSLEQPTSL